MSRLLCALVLLTGCATGSGVNPRGGDGAIDAGLDAGVRNCMPACGAGQICRNGTCVSESTDADMDGTPVAMDCDDMDPAVAASAMRACSSACGAGMEVCTDGVWGPCDAPATCACAPGTPPRTVPCERCGTRQQTCEGGSWVDGPCAGMGACEAGQTETGAACGMCGTERRTCNMTCQWDPYVCEGGGGTCTAGQTQTRTQACGACGEGTRTDTRTCSMACGWGDWANGSCVTAATCTPGQTGMETRACPGGCANQTRTRSCNTTSCQWNGFGDWTACPGCGPVCGNSTCESGETCASCADCRNGHMGSGTGGSSCAGVPAETWRCVTTTACGGPTSQVCRNNVWVNFNCAPQNCAACVCSYSTACCQPGFC